MAMTEQQLRERLRKISALFEGAKTAGEREAAAAAIGRVKQTLETLRPQPSKVYEEPVVEIRFSLADIWQRRLLSALCRRHGLVPFRYRRQRHTTLMVRGKSLFIHTILWPEYVQLRDALDEYLAAATDRIIREEVFNDSREAQERPG